MNPPTVFRNSRTARAAQPARVALLASVVVLFAAVASQGTKRVAAAATEPFPRVTLIGDSAAAAIGYDPRAQSILAERLDLRLELAPCRRVAQQSCPYEGFRPPNVVELVGDLGSQLGPTVVVAVGYNDDERFYAEDLEKALAVLEAAGVERVLWSTLRAERPDYARMNDVIRVAATHHPQLVVVDWNVYSRSHPAWFAPDGLHLRGDGARAMATLFHSTLVRLGIVVPERVVLSTRVLPVGTRGTPYTARLVARGGLPPYRWSRRSPFPRWLTLTRDGRVTGTVRSPTGRTPLVVRVADATGATVTRRFTLRVRAR